VIWLVVSRAILLTRIEVLPIASHHARLVATVAASVAMPNQFHQLHLSAPD
jgi:hypothetical protein